MFQNQNQGMNNNNSLGGFNFNVSQTQNYPPPNANNIQNKKLNKILQILNKKDNRKKN